MKYDEMKNILMSVDDPVARLEVVMEFGTMMPAVPDGAACHEIKGCASRVEICICENRFFATADSAVVRGVAAILMAMVNGHSTEQIRHMDLAGEFESLNLKLGAGRMNGVNSMISFLKNL